MTVLACQVRYSEQCAWYYPLKTVFKQYFTDLYIVIIHAVCELIHRLFLNNIFPFISNYTYYYLLKHIIKYWTIKIYK